MTESFIREEQARTRHEGQRISVTDFVVPKATHAFEDKDRALSQPSAQAEGWTVTYASTSPDSNNEHENRSWTDAYFRVRSWEPILYTILGVRLFKAYVPTGGSVWNRRLGREKEDLKSTAGLNTLIGRTYALEVAHLLSIIPVFAVAAFFNWPLLVTLGMQLVFNVYPIMLQRYNRSLALRKLREIEGV